MIPSIEEFDDLYDELYYLFDGYRYVASGTEGFYIDVEQNIRFINKTYDFLNRALPEYGKFTPTVWFKLMAIYGLMKSISNLRVFVKNKDGLHLTALCNIWFSLAHLMLTPKLWGGEDHIFPVPVNITDVTFHDECIDRTDDGYKYDPECCDFSVAWDMYTDYPGKFYRMKCVLYDTEKSDITELEKGIAEYNKNTQ